MSISNFKTGLLVALSAAFISGYHSQSYHDLEAEGISCPARDSCMGYRNNLTYMDRNCECDHNCTAYKDCCIDALPKRNSRPRQHPRPAARTDVTCLNYGEHDHAGVYVINKCSSSWNGPMTVIFNTYNYLNWLLYILMYNVYNVKQCFQWQGFEYVSEVCSSLFNWVNCACYHLSTIWVNKIILKWANC